MQLFSNLNVRSFVRISRLIWIGRVNRMDSKCKESQGFNNNPREVDEEDDQKQVEELSTNRY